MNGTETSRPRPPVIALMIAKTACGESPNGAELSGLPTKRIFAQCAQEVDFEPSGRGGRGGGA